MDDAAVALLYRSDLVNVQRGLIALCAMSLVVVGFQAARASRLAAMLVRAIRRYRQARRALRAARRRLEVAERLIGELQREARAQRREARRQGAIRAKGERVLVARNAELDEARSLVAMDRRRVPTLTDELLPPPGTPVDFDVSAPG